MIYRRYAICEKQLWAVLNKRHIPACAQTSQRKDTSVNINQTEQRERLKPDMKLQKTTTYFYICLDKTYLD